MIKVMGRTYPWHAGMTVADLLRDIGDSPAIAVVRVNETYVSRPNFAKTLIPDKAEIFMIPMVAGG